MSLFSSLDLPGKRIVLKTNKKLAQCQTQEVSMNELHGIVNYCCFAFIYPFKGMNQKTNDCKYLLAIRYFWKNVEASLQM